jgi:hypothetical protein
MGALSDTFWELSAFYRTAAWIAMPVSMPSHGSEPALRLQAKLCELARQTGAMRDVAVMKARLAFRTFRVVTRGWGFNTET